MEQFVEPIFLRGIERLVIVFGAIAIAYLGYKLYLLGVEKGRGQLKAESKLYTFVLSGQGPGLFFMALSSVVLVTALFTGGNEREVITAKLAKRGDNFPDQKTVEKEIQPIELRLEPIKFMMEQVSNSREPIEIEFEPIQIDPSKFFSKFKTDPIELQDITIERVRYLSEQNMKDTKYDSTTQSVPEQVESDSNQPLNQTP
jgi:hypothetical protein